MAQTRMVQAALGAAQGFDSVETDRAFPIVGMSTTGDQIQDRALLAAGGKGLFTQELEAALMEGRVAFAVHSMKDVPTRLPDGLVIAAMMEREDPSDVLLTREGASRLADLPQGAKLGTASIRRQAQALHQRPDLQISLLRGNVDTRLAKLESGAVDATFLAKAGLKRLGRPQGQLPGMDLSAMLPAVGQGAVGIELKADNRAAIAALAPLNHLDTQLAVTAERAFLDALDGSCRTPIAAYGQRDDDDHFLLKGEVYSPDGAQAWSRSIRIVLGQDPLASVAEAGYAMGRDLKAEGGSALIQALAP